MTRRRAARLVVLAALGYAVALLGRGLRGRRQAMEPVADDLRSPFLYVPLSLRSEKVLRVIRSLPAPVPQLPPLISVSSRTIDTPDGSDLRLVLYESFDRVQPSAALVWIHGGGLVLGEPEQGHLLCGRWAGELGILIISVDYRLAPEDPFPAGLDDCYAAVTWARDHADELGISPDRIAVGGDSAGGGLAAAVSQVARDQGGPAICFQLLEYPMLDDRTGLLEDEAGRGRFLWTAASNRFGWSAYLGDRTAGPPPAYAAPGRTDDLGGLPPAWIGVGDLDLFHDEDVAYARRLEAAGVPCELDVVAGMYHGADAVLPKAPTAAAFRDRMTDALARGLGIDAARLPGEGQR
jgi:acetyl esterase/lipase